MRISKYLLLLFLTLSSQFCFAWEKVGEAQLSVLWFDVYKAQLFSPDGEYQGLKAPLKLQLTYQRNISKQDLLNETASQLKGKVADKSLQLWIEKLSTLWPDIRKGQQLSFEMLDEDKGIFVLPDKSSAEVEYKGFAKAFINIWLDEKGEYPKQARALKGETK